MAIMETKSKTRTAPLGIFAGLAIAVLFRGHLHAEYVFIMACLCAAALAVTVYAIGHTRKTQQDEQLAFEEKLRFRRTNLSAKTSN